MDVGLFLPLGALNATPEFLRAAGPAIEERGFESIWLAEHVVLFDDYDSAYPYSPDGKFPGGGDTGILDPFIGLTYLAAVTDRVRLGTGICLVPQRNPVYTAKQGADLDVLSGGRFDLGVGVGWLREEFEALMVPFERRGVRADDHLAVIRSLWTDEVSEYHGEAYELRPCRMYPKPTQSPHPPIHVGGESDAALGRVARVGDGWFTFNRTPEEIPAAVERLEAALAAEGRSRSEVQLSVCPYFNALGPAEVEAYAAAGVDRLIAVCFAFDVDGLASTLDDLVAGVLEPARSVSSGS